MKLNEHQEKALLHFHEQMTLFAQQHQQPQSVNNNGDHTNNSTNTNRNTNNSNDGNNNIDSNNPNDTDTDELSHKFETMRLGDLLKNPMLSLRRVTPSRAAAITGKQRQKQMAVLLADSEEEEEEEEKEKEQRKKTKNKAHSKNNHTGAHKRWHAHT